MPVSAMPLTPYDPVATLQAVAHDPTALARLIAEEGLALSGWLRRMLRNDELAQEAVQETWIIVSQGKWQFVTRGDDPASDVRAWLRQIGLRAAWRLRERQRTYQRQVGNWLRQRAVSAPAPTPLEQLVARDRQEVVWALVAELPPPMREVVRLRFQESLDFPAIGRAMGCTALTARLRAWRGLSRLRRHLLAIGILVMSGPLCAALGSGTGVVVDATPINPTADAGEGAVNFTSRRRLGVMVSGLTVILAIVGWLMLHQMSANEAKHEVTGNPIFTDSKKESPKFVLDKEAQKNEENAPPAQRPKEIGYKFIVIEPGHTNFLLDSALPIVLTPAQNEKVSAWTAQHADKVRAVPKIMSPPGSLGSLTIDGLTCEVQGRVTAEGLQIEASATIVINHPESKGPEKVVTISRTLPLPTGGVCIPRGGSLLLPAHSGYVKQGTSSEVVDPAFNPWWVLISSFEVNEPVPSPESDAEKPETIAPQIPSGNF